MRSLPLRPNGKDHPLMKDPILLILIDFLCKNNNNNNETVFASNVANQDIMHKTADQNHLTLQGCTTITTTGDLFNLIIHEVPFILTSLIDHRRPLTPATHHLHIFVELTLEPHMMMTKRWLMPKWMPS